MRFEWDNNEAVNQESEFPLERARRVTPVEQFGIDPKKRGRPMKEEDKYAPISIRLHPKILVWAKEEAKQRGIGYQTVINEVLLSQISYD